MNLTPYLSFQGNCEAAVNFYKKHLGGELKVIHFEGSPMQVAEEDKHKVMHACLCSKNIHLFASDIVPMNGQKPTFQPGDTVYLSLNFDVSEMAEAEKIFAAFSEGATVFMPLGETFWAAKFGMLKDKFGIRWMFNVEIKKDNSCNTDSTCR